MHLLMISLPGTVIENVKKAKEANLGISLSVTPSRYLGDMKILKFSYISVYCISVYW